MRIGVPKEIKNHEYRVGLIPSSVHELIHHGHDVVVQTGAGAAVLGHPAASVAMLANMLAERGEYLPAGSFVMIGAITAAVQVEKGDAFVVHFQDLGSISGRFE